MKAAPFWRAWPEDLMSALRSVAASPGYSLPALLSVTLGLGATVVIYAVFHAVILRPLPFPHEETLVALFDESRSPGRERTVVSAPELVDYAAARSLTAVASYMQSEGTITGVGEPRHAVVAQCSKELFDALGVLPLMGRTFRAATDRDDASGAVIGHAFWLSALGGGPALGKAIVVDGLPRTIIGVLPRARALPAEADVWIPLRLTAEQATHRGYRFLAAIARLSSGATVATAQRELDGISEAVERSLGSRGRKMRAVIVPLRDELLGNHRVVVRFLLAAVVIFLLLSCSNVAALLLTRASVRAHELAVRAAIGASPARLFGQSLLETLLLVILGSALGLGLGVVALGLVTRFYGDLLAYAEPTLDLQVGLLFAVVSIITVIVIGGAPARRAARVRSMDALRQGGRASPGRAARRLREALVVVQVAASVLLLIGATGLIRSVGALSRVEPGFSTGGVVTGRLTLPMERYDTPDKLRQFCARTLDSLRLVPRSQAAAVSLMPFMNSYAIRVALEGQPGEEPAVAEQRSITPDYFTAMGIPLVAGRAFGDGDRADTEAVAIVNRTFARALLHDASVLGQRFSDGTKSSSGAPRWLRVVGVVGDSRDFGLDVPARATFYLPFAQTPVNELSIVMHSDEIPAAGLLHQLGARVHAIDAELPLYALAPLEELLQGSYRARTVLTYLLVAFAAAALLLASIGLFGVTSYSVSQRAAELAIRRALGASRSRTVRFVLGETTLVVGGGVALGIAGAWLCHRLMSSLLFGLSPLDAVTLCIAGLVAFSISMLAALVPSLRAAAVEMGALLRS